MDRPRRQCHPVCTVSYTSYDKVALIRDYSRLKRRKRQQKHKRELDDGEEVGARQYEGDEMEEREVYDDLD